MTPAKRFELSDRAIVWLFLVPCLLLLIGMVGYPFVSLVILSFYRFSILRSDAGREYIGLENYDFLLSDPELWERFIFTGQFVIISVACQFVIGIFVAYNLQKNFRARDIIFTVLMMPMMVCPIVVGFLWRYMFNSEWGVVNYLATLMGSDKIDWLGVTDNALVAVVIADTWMWTPFVILLATAAFRGIPKVIYEAADIDGASAFYRFTRITLPLSAPILFIALLLRMIDSFKQYDLFFAMTGGGPGSTTQTVSFNLGKVAFSYFYTGEASALAVILLLIIIGLSLVLVRYLNLLSAKTRG